MNKTEYEQINETLYHEVLPNGLTVYLLPKNDYHKTYGLFSTNYGSIDNEFIPYGEKEKVKVPDGIAHFLEHKMVMSFNYLGNKELPPMLSQVLRKPAICFLRRIR